MAKKKWILLVMIAIVLSAVACIRVAGRPGSGRFAGQAEGGRPGDGPGGEVRLSNPPTPENPDISAYALIEVPEGAQRTVDPLPLIDLSEYVALIPYEVTIPNVTTASDSSSAAANAASASNQYVSPLLVAPTPAAPPPPVVVISGAVSVPSGRNAATCIIPGVGECQATMDAGTDIHLTWTFEQDSTSRFEWWDAQIVVTRNGEAFLVHSAANGLERSGRAADSDEKWVLPVGQSAEFRVGLGDVEAGIYSAYLQMCLRSEPCTAGGARTRVGGDTIQFLIVQPLG